MKRDDEGGGQGDAEAKLVERVRERMSKGSEATRHLISRARELLVGRTPQPSAAAASSPEEEPEEPPTEHAPQKGGDDAWQPRPEKPARAPSRPVASNTPRDEDDDEDGEGVGEVPAEFATATMGMVLLSQGRTAEARAVFERVLARDPDDDEARRGLTEARALEANEAAWGAPGQEPTEMLDRIAPPWSYNVCEARALPVDPVTIVVFWELTDEAVERAERQIGPGATKSVCVVSMWSTADGVERATRWVDDVPQIGDWFVTGVPAGATHHTAVGLRRGAQFLPIAHASPVSTPRGRPSSQVARVRATVALPPREPAAEDVSLPRGPAIVALDGPPDALAAMGLRGANVTQHAPEEGPARPGPEVFARFLGAWRGVRPGSSEQPAEGGPGGPGGAQGAAGAQGWVGRGGPSSWILPSSFTLPASDKKW